LAVSCTTFRETNLSNFRLKCQTVAEKTVKNFTELFLPHHVDLLGLAASFQTFKDRTANKFTHFSLKFLQKSFWALLDKQQTVSRIDSK